MCIAATRRMQAKAWPVLPVIQEEASHDASRSCLKTSQSKFNKLVRESQSVSFDTVQVRSFYMEIGSNVCSQGVPVALSQDFKEETNHDIDLYEIERKPRRKTSQLRLSDYKRRCILLLAGHSTDEIKEAELDIAKVRRQRSKTVMLMPMSRLGEVVSAVVHAGRKMNLKLDSSRVGIRGGSHSGLEVTLSKSVAKAA
jgi:hypothetical protein